jgi:DNA-binding NarL/FixJ family response regulator
VLSFMMLQSDVRVLVVADDTFIRAGLVTLLGERPGITIVGQTAPDGGLIAPAQIYRPDVIVWEIAAADALEAESLNDIKDVDAAVLALLGDEDHAPALAASGVQGVLGRKADADMIAAAIAALTVGLLVYSPSVSTVLMSARAVEAPVTARETLTARENEVLRLLAEGLANKQIALYLNISEHTVKFHVNAIMGKLGVQSRTEAVVRATRLGWIAL